MRVNILLNFRLKTLGYARRFPVWFRNQMILLAALNSAKVQCPLN